MSNAFLSDAIDAWELSVKLMKAGLLTKVAHGKALRLSPPLTINRLEMNEAMDAMKATINAV